MVEEHEERNKIIEKDHTSEYVEHVVKDQGFAICTQNN